jgi:TolA-binding protein
MNKLTKLTANSLLMIVLFGLIVLPISTMGLANVTPEQNILSTESVRLAPEDMQNVSLLRRALNEAERKITELEELLEQKNAQIEELQATINTKQ